jgi:hypothetical protein
MAEGNWSTLVQSLSDFGILLISVFFTWCYSKCGRRKDSYNISRRELLETLDSLRANAMRRWDDSSVLSTKEIGALDIEISCSLEKLKFNLKVLIGHDSLNPGHGEAKTELRVNRYIQLRKACTLDRWQCTNSRVSVIRGFREIVTDIFPEKF